MNWNAKGRTPATVVTELRQANGVLGVGPDFERRNMVG